MNQPVDAPPSEMFPHIPGLESAEITRIEEMVALHRRAISLADSLLGMANTEGYKRFVACVEDIKAANYAKLTSPVTKTDREASLLIGACRAMDDILVLMTSTQANRARLAATLQAAEDHLDKLRNPSKQEFMQ